MDLLRWVRIQITPRDLRLKYTGAGMEDVMAILMLFPRTKMVPIQTIIQVIIHYITRQPVILITILKPGRGWQKVEYLITNNSDNNNKPCTVVPDLALTLARYQPKIEKILSES